MQQHGWTWRLAEVSQTEKEKYMISLICGIPKKILHTKQKQTHRHRRQTHRRRTQTYAYQRGKGGWKKEEYGIKENKLHKIDKQQGPTL